MFDRKIEILVIISGLLFMDIIYEIIIVVCLYSLEIIRNYYYYYYNYYLYYDYLYYYYYLFDLFYKYYYLYDY